MPCIRIVVLKPRLVVSELILQSRSHPVSVHRFSDAGPYTDFKAKARSVHAVDCDLRQIMWCKAPGASMRDFLGMLSQVS